jgi:hypothetical protein
MTDPNHPLAGWRYWRAFTVTGGHIRVETGAIDVPAPGIKNFFGFWISRGQQLDTWRQYMDHIWSVLNASNGASRLVDGPREGYLSGVWEFDKAYIIENICGQHGTPSTTGLWICH